VNKGRKKGDTRQPKTGREKTKPLISQPWERLKRPSCFRLKKTLMERREETGARGHGGREGKKIESLRGGA